MKTEWSGNSFTPAGTFRRQVFHLTMNCFLSCITTPTAQPVFAKIFWQQYGRIQNCRWPN